MRNIRRQLPALATMLVALVISGLTFTFYVYLGINEANSVGWYFFGPWGILIALTVCIAPHALAAHKVTGNIWGTIIGVAVTAFALFCALVWQPSFVVNVDWGSLGFGLFGLVIFAAAYGVYVAGHHLANKAKVHAFTRRSVPAASRARVSF